MKQAVRRATEIVAAAPSHHASAVRRQAPSLQASVAVELLQGKREARIEGRERLQAELGHSFPITFEAEADAAASFISAAGLTAAWGNAALSAIAASAPVSKAATAIAPSVERTVATEVARSFNDERHSLLVTIGGGHGGPDEEDRERHHPAKGMFKIWSALLDGKTCSRCFEADGEIVELTAAFTHGTPPLHPHCRCVIEHILVPRPERLEDISIDYDLFKQELRDIIREGRAGSERHALGFASDSLGATRSPQALTRRFADEPYAIGTPAGSRGGTPQAPPTPPRRPAPPPPAVPAALTPAPPAKPPAAPAPQRPLPVPAPAVEPRLAFTDSLSAADFKRLPGKAITTGDLKACTAHLFDGKCPDEKSWRKLWEPPPGYVVKFESFDAFHQKKDDYSSLRISAYLEGPDGRRAGEMIRVFKRQNGELTAKHELLELEKQHQGKGIGEALTRSALQSYPEMGVSQIKVDAAWVGRYTWSTFGFSWPAEEGPEWRDKFEGFLLKKLGDAEKARAGAQLAMHGAHAVSELVVDGKKLGKEFLLDDSYVPMWSGALRLKDGDVGYEKAKRRMKL